MKNFFSLLILSFLFIVVYNKKDKNVDKESLYAEPDKYAKFFHEISHLDEGPNYYPGYRQVELNKMLDRLKNNRLSIIDQVDVDIPFSASAIPNVTFTERGPNNVPGRTRGVVIDASDPNDNTWYAAGVGGGLWKGIYNPTTKDVSWENITPLTVQNLAIVTLAQSAMNPDIIYAGTGESALGASTAIDGDGIYKIDLSDPENPIWTNISPKVGGLINHRFGSVSRLIVDPLDFNIVVAATYSPKEYDSYIFRSTDGGVSWSKVYEEYSGDEIQQIVSAPSDFNIQYAAVKGNKVLKSTDAGSTWNQTAAFNISEYYRVELVVSNTNPNKVYAGVYGGSSGPCYLFRTVNGGASWYHIKENGSLGNTEHLPDYWLNKQGWRDNTLGLNPYDDNILYGGGVYLYKFHVLDDSTKITEKMVSCWTDCTPHVDNQFMQGIDDGDGNFRLLNANDGGVAISNSSSDPGMSFNNWKKADDGNNTSQFYGADKIIGRQQYIGGMQDNGTHLSPSSENASATTNYSEKIGGDGFEVIAHWKKPNYMMGGAQYNNLYRSLNGGNSWNPIGLLNEMKGEEIAPFLVRLSNSYHEPDVVYAIHDTDGVWKSTDFGANWNLKKIEDGGWDGWRKDVEISLSNPRFVWAGGGISNGRRLYLSKDWGESFSPVTKAIDNSVSSSGIYSHPTEDSTAYVLFSYFGRAKIFETKDLGNSWTDISGFPLDWEKGFSDRGFPNVRVYSLCVMPFDPNIIWVGTDIGIVETKDRGGSWNIISSDLPHVNIWDMKIKDQGEIVLATHGRGIWTATIPDLMDYKPQENLITISTTNGSQNVNIEENGGNATIKVTASRDVNPGNPVVVSLRLGGTAVGGEDIYPLSDYTISSNPITIPSGKSITATITSLNDSRIENDETIVIDIASVTNGKAVENQQINITINDGDNIVTGVEDFIVGKNIDIYPNPNSGTFKIRFIETWEGNINVRIVDVFGRVQYHRNIEYSYDQEEYEVDISNKMDGLYFLVLSQDDKKIIKKVIKK